MNVPTWPQVLSALVAGRDLATSETAWVMEEILGGNATPAQIAGFAVAVRAKGETQAEVQGLVDAMYAHAVPLSVPGRVVDIVGTGGDMAKTVNISTTAAIVIAGAGVPVVKHGGRASSSASGSADVLERLGVRLDVPAERVGDVLQESGITFCFAPVFHSSLRYSAAPRRELGIATVFNFLGPLTNPARPDASAIGCADVRMAPIMAGVFADRGADAIVFRGDDGLDEITVTAPTRAWVASGGTVSEDRIDPHDFGIEYCEPEALRGAEPEYNAQVLRQVLAGDRTPVRDAVLLNAAAAIAAHEGTSGALTERLRSGLARATESIDSGAAAAVLDRWATTTQSFVA